MKNNFISSLSLLIIAFLSYNPSFLCAQALDINEVTPLELLKGRIFEIDISSEKYLILRSGKEGKNYLLRTDFRREVASELKEIAQKNWEAEISGILKGFREFTIVEFQYAQDSPSEKEEEVKKEGKKIVLPVIDVAAIHSINKDAPPQAAPDLYTLFAVPPDFQKDYSFPAALKRVTGIVSKCNFESIIPTIELKGKPEFIILLPAGTEAMKVVGDNLMSFQPKDVIKEGVKLEIWYEEDGDLKNARIISVQDKDIASQ